MAKKTCTFDFVAITPCTFFLPIKTYFNCTRITTCTVKKLTELPHYLPRHHHITTPCQQSLELIVKKSCTLLLLQFHPILLFFTN